MTRLALALALIAAPAHRSIIAKADAGRLVRLYYGKPLETALSEGLI